MTKLLTLVVTLLLITGCEGFKVLTIYNVSDNEVKVTIKPKLDYSANNNNNNNNNQNIPLSDSSTVVLRQDSSLTILSIFTGMMFNVKIKENDLQTDYLKIETKTDTIIADSRKEILQLLKDKRTRYSRKTDKEKVLANSRNFGNIFIRK